MLLIVLEASVVLAIGAARARALAKRGAPGTGPGYYVLVLAMALTLEDQISLVQQARDGDPPARARAIERLLDDFRAPAMAVIHRSLAAAGVGREHAEEAWLQAAFKFYSVGLRRFESRGGAAPRTYFVRTALNAAVDLVRAQARSRPAAEIEVPAADPLVARQEEIERGALMRALAECVEDLPADYGRAVEQYYLEQAGSCASCAEQVGASKPAFMKRLQRAREKLADCVRERVER